MMLRSLLPSSAPNLTVHEGVRLTLSHSRSKRIHQDLTSRWNGLPDYGRNRIFHQAECVTRVTEKERTQLTRPASSTVHIPVNNVLVG